MVSVIGLRQAESGCKWSWTIVDDNLKATDYETNHFGEGIYIVAPGTRRQIAGDCDFYLRGLYTKSGAYKRIRKYFDR